MKQVVILAGGKSKRLRERLGSHPKPLIDICGKPLLGRQIELVKRHGYTHVLLLVNYAAQQILEFCASRNNWGLHIDCIDDGVPLGTAGATLAVFAHLEEEFLVLYGDTMLEIDLTRFHAFHRSRPNVSATLFLHPNDHPQDSDLVETDDEGRITAFHPYPHNAGCYYRNLVNAALYYIRRAALESWRNSPGPLDFCRDIFPAMLKRGHVLRGYKSPEYIKDCGTPDRLDKVRADFAAGRVARASLDVKQQAIFLDRDGVINREVNLLHDISSFELLPGAAEAIRMINQSSYLAIVITNQPVIARNLCSVETLGEIHKKMETLLGNERAYIDGLYYCPHHPERGFKGEVTELKIECDCRKPKPGLLLKAAQEFNIDLEKSYFIGDRYADIKAGKDAGVKTILLYTGHSGIDQAKYNIAADYNCDALTDAVEKILGENK